MHNCTAVEKEASRDLMLTSYSYPVFKKGKMSSTARAVEAARADFQAARAAQAARAHFQILRANQIYNRSALEELQKLGANDRRGPGRAGDHAQCFSRAHFRPVRAIRDI